jgi:hypothetical protein
MVEQERPCSPPANAKDWAGTWSKLAGVWGLPAALMLAASFLDPPLRAIVCTVVLIWMGVACLANARRCGRTHCRYTGPFFLLMAALVVAHATGMVPLGPHGWWIVGGTIAMGNAALWWGTERWIEKYSPSDP